MGELITEEVFAAPQWQKITYWIVSLLVFALGINVLMIKNGGWLSFLAPLIFFIAVSMLVYTRQKLIISNNEIRFVGSFYIYEVPLTRQQIANLTGLCVETVIRTVKKMEQVELVKINGRHIIY